MIDGSENINLISCYFQLICYVNDNVEVEVQNMGEFGYTDQLMILS